MIKARDIDAKFAVSTTGEIYKRSNDEIIPNNEPLFLLRGRDILALEFFDVYKAISYKENCNEYHFKKLNETILEFIKFKRDHPERMKMPSITEGK